MVLRRSHKQTGLIEALIDVLEEPHLQVTSLFHFFHLLFFHLVSYEFGLDIKENRLPPLQDHVSFDRWSGLFWSGFGSTVFNIP